MDCFVEGGTVTWAAEVEEDGLRLAWDNGERMMRKYRDHRLELGRDYEIVDA